jgi:hypothetical protein
MQVDPKNGDTTVEKITLEGDAVESHLELLDPRSDDALKLVCLMWQSGTLRHHRYCHAPLVIPSRVGASLDEWNSRMYGKCGDDNG